MNKYEYKKPPLGVMPKKYHDRGRAIDIWEAIKRYQEVEKLIPIEWFAELRDIVARY